MFRRKQRNTPPPTAVSDIPARWRPAIDELSRLVAELQHVVTATAAGPVQDRLREFEDSLRAHLTEIADVATRGATLLRLTETLDVEAITSAYKKAKRDGDPDAEVLERQHASAQRLLNALDDVDTHVGKASLRARELLLAAGELALTGSDRALDEAQRSVALLADEASALRDAVRSLN